MSAHGFTGIESIDEWPHVKVSVMTVTEQNLTGKLTFGFLAGVGRPHSRASGSQGRDAGPVDSEYGNYDAVTLTDDGDDERTAHRV